MSALNTTVGERHAIPPRSTTARTARIGWEGFKHLRCVGRTVFRTVEELDLALILDLEPTVRDWRCLPDAVAVVADDGSVVSHQPAFEIHRFDGSRFLLDTDGASVHGLADQSVEYRNAIDDGMMTEARVRNARGIMSCADTPVPLSDQVRLLSLLDCAGAVPLSRAVEELKAAPDPIAALMALAAHRFVLLDWKSDVIGPRTCVEPARSPRPRTFPRARDASARLRRR